MPKSKFVLLITLVCLLASCTMRPTREASVYGCDLPPNTNIVNITFGGGASASNNTGTIYVHRRGQAVGETYVAKESNEYGKYHATLPEGFEVTCIRTRTQSY